MKFMIYKDYKAGSAINFEYTDIEARSLEEAIEAADQMWNECESEIYLMQIMKKTGNIVAPYKAGYKYEPYEAILCRRSFGWHRNIKENCEAEHKTNKCWLTNNKNEVWYETL